ncbi:hypothetical protein V6O07_12100, partial [Arthrospira platensis SPKY2]
AQTIAYDDYVDATVAWDARRPEASPVTLDRLTTTAQRQWSEAVKRGDDAEALDGLYDSLRRSVRPGKKGEPLVRRPQEAKPTDTEPTPPPTPGGRPKRDRTKEATKARTERRVAGADKVRGTRAVQEPSPETRPVREEPSTRQEVREQDPQEQEAPRARQP